MKQAINKILQRLSPGIEGDGGRLELVEIEQGGTIHLKQEENCGNCISTVWTHRLRVERAIKEEFPDVIIKVDLES